MPVDVERDRPDVFVTAANALIERRHRVGGWSHASPVERHEAREAVRTILNVLGRHGLHLEAERPTASDAV